MHIAIYDDKHALSEHATEYIMRIANESIDLHGHFTIALTGGTTPGEVYSLIGSEPFRSQIDWQFVDIFWGDERCLPQNNTDVPQNATFRGVGAQFIAPNPQASCRYNYHIIIPIEAGAMNCAP